MEYFSQIRSWVAKQVQSSGGLVPFFGFLFVGIYVFLNPFPHTTALRNISFYLAILLVIVHLLRKKEWKVLANPFLIPVGLFVMWVLIGLFFALDISRSVHDFRAFLLNYIVLFCLLAITFPTCSRLRILSWIVILSVTASSLHEIFIWYIQADHPFSSRIASVNQQLPVGPIGMMALFALFLSLALLTSAYEKRLQKILLCACSIVLLTTIVFAQTRAVFLAMFFSFGLLFWGKKRSLVFFLIVGIALSGYAFLHSRSVTNVGHYTDRLTINYVSYLIFKEHPIMGIGFGFDTFGDPNFIDQKHYLEQVPKEILNEGVTLSSPHNLWMGILVRTGLVGFCLFIAVYARALKMSLWLMTGLKNDEANMWGRVGSACLVAIGIYGLFNVVTLHFLMMLLCVCLFFISNAYRNFFISRAS